MEPGLAAISLPCPSSLRRDRDDPPPTPEEEEEEEDPKTCELVVGDECSCIFGRGEVTTVRENGLVELTGMSWSMCGGHRPKFIMQRQSLVKADVTYGSYTTAEKIYKAQRSKAQGTELFAKKDYEGACRKYALANTLLKYVTPSADEERAQMLKVMIPCHNNLATCYLRLKNFQHCSTAAQNAVLLCEALEAQKGGKVMQHLRANGVSDDRIFTTWMGKGLFIEGRARLQMRQYDEGIASLEKAMVVLAGQEQDVQEIKRLKALAQRHAAKQKQHEKKMWSHAFSKSAVEGTSEGKVEANDKSGGTSASQKAAGNGTATHGPAAAGRRLSSELQRRLSLSAEQFEAEMAKKKKGQKEDVDGKSARKERRSLIGVAAITAAALGVAGIVWARSHNRSRS